MYYIETSHSPLAKMAESFLQLIFPMSTYCLCCGKYIDKSRSYCLCDHCIKHIKWGHVFIDLEKEAKQLCRPRVLDSVRACMKYGLYERRLIFDLKYDGLTYLSRVISQIMFERIMSDSEAIKDIESTDFVVPVPMYKEKEKQRGFNQADKMAYHLAKRLHKKEIPDALVRNKSTVAQRSVTGYERYANLNSAFSVNPKHKEKINGKKILLIDDVYTTGATGYHCGEALKEAGAERVDLMVLATGNDFAGGFTYGPLTAH